MNCHQFRKYLHAFADGQIDVKSNCDLLDHLKMCHECSRIVDQHNALKSLIVASAARIAVPAGLESRIRSAIEPSRKSRKRAASLVGPFADRPLLRVSAMAACVVITVLSLWATGIVGPGESLRGGLATSADFDMDSADLKMRGVVVRHNKCVESCNQQAHQLAGLPSDRESAALELAGRLGDQVAIAAPDLTGFGYEFESAAVCSPDREVHGATAHMMYVNHAYGTRLSFFSVPHWKGADGLLADATLRKPFAFTPQGNCQNQSIVAWNGKTSTYIVCAPINQEDLSEMVRELAFSLPADAVGDE